MLLEFLLVMERMTDESTDPKLMDYALKKASGRIKRAATALLDNTPRNIGVCKWRRWGDA